MLKKEQRIFIAFCATIGMIGGLAFAQQPLPTPPIAPSVGQAVSITNDVTVQGDVASGAADSGNPAKIGCQVNTNPSVVFSTGQRSNCNSSGTGALNVNLLGFNTGNQVDAAAQNSDGQTTARSGLNTTSTILGFNGTTQDRMRGSATQGLQVAPQAYPFGATAVVNSNQGTTASTAATLAAAASKTTFVCGFEIDASATAAAANGASMSGLVGGVTMQFFQQIGAGTSVARTITNFTPCLPGNAVNTAITITSAAAGAGGNTFVNIWGFQQ